MLISNDESGQGLVEYGLILILVAMAIVVTLGLFGNNTVLTMFQKVVSIFPTIG